MACWAQGSSTTARSAGVAHGLQRMPTHGIGKKIGESATELHRRSAAGRRIEILFDQHQFLEQVFVIICLAGTIGLSTSQAEAP
jgi:hypothetical protein